MTQLRDRLLGAGVDESDVDDLLQDIQKGQTDDDVDVERLAKAMEGVRNSMEKANDLDTAPEWDADGHYADKLAEAESVVEAVSAGADTIIMQMQKHLDAHQDAQGVLLDQQQIMAKGLLELGETVQELRTALLTDRGQLNKSLARVADAVSEPLEPMAVFGDADAYIQTPAEAAQSPGPGSRATVIQKALVEISTCGNQTRAQSLHKAIVLLESGASTDEIVAQYGLN